MAERVVVSNGIDQYGLLCHAGKEKVAAAVIAPLLQ